MGSQSFIPNLIKKSSTVINIYQIKTLIMLLIKIGKKLIGL